MQIQSVLINPHLWYSVLSKQIASELARDIISSSSLDYLFRIVIGEHDWKGEMPFAFVKPMVIVMLAEDAGGSKKRRRRLAYRRYAGYIPEIGAGPYIFPLIMGNPAAIQASICSPACTFWAYPCRRRTNTFVQSTLEQLYTSVTTH